jgi:hypothetical protein
MVSYYASAVEPCLSDHYNHDEVDLQVFMDRVMDDAASDIHQLIDKNVALTVRYPNSRIWQIRAHTQKRNIKTERPRGLGWAVREAP